MDWEKIAAGLVPKEAIGKLYDDALSGPAKELGKLGADALKVARLLLFPLQIAASFQDRLEPLFERLAQRVPPERRLDRGIPAEIVGPCLDHMQYLSDRSELWQMFEEVLARALDKDGIASVHPAFVVLIRQLSSDEARILLLLSGRDFKVEDEMDYDAAANRFSSLRILESEFPKALLSLPENELLYLSHLVTLGLVEWPVLDQVPVREAHGIQTGIVRHSVIRLSSFGRLFASSCIPVNGFSESAGIAR